MRGLRRGPTLGLALALACATADARSQVITGIGADGTTPTQVSLANTGTYTIDGGTRSGGNLFHSFQGFDLGFGDQAIWLRSPGDGAQIDHVINRVTGGMPSRIDGTLTASALPNASFWFINPAGIVFGKGASINVSNAAHFSTAHEIRFPGGAVFSAVTPSGSTFSMAAPDAFGFLGGQGDIAVSGVGPDFARSPLSLSASNVRIVDSAFSVTGLDVAAVDDASVRLDTAEVGRAAVGNGTLLIEDSRIESNATSRYNGEVNLAAGRMTVRSDAEIRGLGGAGLVGGDLNVSAGRLDLTDAARLSTEAARDQNVGNAGDIRIMVDALYQDGGSIGSSTSGAGNAGAVEIRAGLVDIARGGASSVTFGTGHAGSVLIEADRFTMNAGLIDSSAFDESTGNAGSVTIRANDIDLRASLIATQTFASGAAGDVAIVAGTLTMTEASAISSTAYGRGCDTCQPVGAAGAVTVQAGMIDMGGEAVIEADTFDATGGRVSVTAERLALTDRARISSSTRGTGDAGSVKIQAGALTIENSAQISSRSSVCDDQSCAAGGKAGAVDVRADTIDMSFGVILSDTNSEGDAGMVSVEAGRLVMEQSSIGSSAFGFYEANAGRISVSAGLLDMVLSQILSENYGRGTGGQVVVSADVMTMSLGSRISSSAPGCPADLCGRAGDAGAVGVQARVLDISNSTIESNTFSDGNAGAVSVKADRLSLTDSASVSSFTAGAGNAGTVVIEAGDISLSQGGRIESSQQTDGSGDAGSILITARTLRVARDVDDQPAISTSIVNAGRAGSIDIAAAELTLNGGSIASSAGGVVGGVSGDVSLTAEQLTMTDGARIETVSLNPETAGSIVVESADVLLQDGSRITSDNLSTGGGAAGLIQLVADRIRLQDGGEISTNSATGAAGDIEVLMPTNGLLVLAGADRPGVITTSSGPGTGGRIVIDQPFLILSDGGRILAVGEEGGANVRLGSAFFIRSADRLNLVSVDGSLIVDSQVGDLSSGTEAADLSFLDASAVLRGQCAGGDASGRTSRFSARPTGPYGAPVAGRTADGIDPLARMLTGGGCR